MDSSTNLQIEELRHELARIADALENIDSGLEKITDRLEKNTKAIFDLKELHRARL